MSRKHAVRNTQHAMSTPPTSASLPDDTSVPMDTTPPSTSTSPATPTQLEVLAKLNDEAREKQNALESAAQLKAQLAELQLKEIERQKRKLDKERQKRKQELSEYSRVIEENQKIKALAPEHAERIMQLFAQANAELERDECDMKQLQTLTDKAHIEARASASLTNEYQARVTAEQEAARLKKENESLIIGRQCADQWRAYTQMSANAPEIVRTNASRASATNTPATTPTSSSASASNVPGMPSTRGIPMPNFTSALANAATSTSGESSAATTTSLASTPSGALMEMDMNAARVGGVGEYCIDTRASIRDLIKTQGGVDPSQYRHPYQVAKERLGRAPTYDEVEDEMMQMAYFRNELVHTRASIAKGSVGFSFKHNPRTGRYEPPTDTDVHDMISVPVDENYKQIVQYPASDVRRRLRFSMRQNDPNFFYDTLQKINDKSLSNDQIDAELTNTRNMWRSRNRLEPFTFTHNNIDHNHVSDVCFER